MKWCPKCGGMERIWTENGVWDCQFCTNGTITADQLEPDTIPCPKCDTDGYYWRGNEVEICNRCNGELYIKVTQLYWIRKAIEDYFLFSHPWRRLLLKLSNHLPKRMSEWLVDRLYPDDMGIGF